MKKWLLFASAICLVMVIAACGSNTAKVDNKETNTSVADSGATSSDLVVTASNYKFDKKEYKIKAGESVNIKLDSIDGIHGIQIKNTEYKIGHNETVAINITEPGSYEMICSVPCGSGHRNMMSTLIVE